MIKSNLTNIVVEASPRNYTKGRNGHKVCKITIHHMAGILSAKRCGELFQNPKRRASANYGIGNDGQIACYVGEENRAWTSSNRNNDYQAITIEVSNCGIGGDWSVSKSAYESLIRLCTDICKRYKFSLVYDGTPNGSLTRHNMFAKTTCPGPYLQSRFPEIVERVNANLNNKPAYPGTLIKKGSKGENVRKVQNRLIELGYSVGRYGADGVFGNNTDKAVRTYQKENGLAVDGKVGPATWKKLFN
jgi:N-acetyl-anhydromuramyl-L-alanine amidase AmpD